MRILLDTNALIWLLEQNETGKSLGGHTKKLLSSAETVYASPISIVEIRIKSMVGKLGSKLDLLDDVAKAGLHVIDYSTLAADMITSFPTLIRHDPFDRMILSQAKAENLTLVTADQTLLGLGLNYVVDARV